MRVLIASRPAYVPGLLGNKGVSDTGDSEFYAKHQVMVKLRVEDDPVKCAEALKRRDADVIWSTVDSLPSVISRVPDSRAIMLAGWSNTDKIVSLRTNSGYKGLRNKNTGVVPNSSSQWLLQHKCPDANCWTTLFSTSRAAYEELSPQAEKNQKIQAAAVWGPEVISAQRNMQLTVFDPDGKEDKVADIFVTLDTTLDKRGGDIEAFIKCWLETAHKANSLSPEAKTDLADLLVQHTGYGLFAPEELRGLVKSAVENAKLAELPDNVRFLGLDESSESSSFDTIFWDASNKRVYPGCAKYLLSLKHVQSSGASEGRVEGAQVDCDRAAAYTRTEVHFGSNDAILDKANKKVLYDWWNKLGCYKSADDYFCVEGYADEIGSDDDNFRLSDKRNRSVVDYLKTIGAHGSSLIAKPYGKTKPVDTTGTEEGRHKNRRAVVFVEAQ
ncbi:MAG: OmpA family protein [Bryobacteraceae bacterium]